MREDHNLKFIDAGRFKLRSRFWIPKGRTEVKRMINRCRVCKRWNSTSFKLPPVASLPETRIIRSRPFAHVGVDYFGPLLIKGNNMSTKRNVQLETPTGKLLDRPINVLYPLEVEDEDDHLELNNKESTKILETEQDTGKSQEPIAIRTRSSTKRKLQSKAASLLLQRSDVTEKRVDGRLLIAPCKSDSLNLKIIEFKGGLISKLEIDRINAALEVLAQNQQLINPILKPRETSNVWNELSQQGQELSEQFMEEFERR
ncbi:unnamed protein product, partial [Acanthocheilonema viteae]